MHPFQALAGLLLFLTSCMGDPKYLNTDVKNITLISDHNSYSDSPFLTKDEKGNPVISWVSGTDSNTIFNYSIMTENTFKDIRQVPLTRGLSSHRESMPKIAFKNNGDMIVMYQQRRPTMKNKYGGVILYTQSFDRGVSWTKSKYLHTGDTSAGIGRSFFDIATLPNGEIGAIWLDGRKKTNSGSNLYFSETKGKIGFISETLLADHACQCCRTDLYVSKDDKINVAFRNIFNDSIRDIAFVQSSDGKVFTQTKKISADNWVINGCPHTGPSMSKNSEGLNFFWYTRGGQPGIYSTIFDQNKNIFKKRTQISENAEHPQSITTKSGEIVIVWDEVSQNNKGRHFSKIGVQFNSEKKHYISEDKGSFSFPVLQESKNGDIVIAWTSKKENQSHVYYKIFSKRCT